jgi:hypothetical protein
MDPSHIRTTGGPETTCESPVGVSHIGFGWCVAVFVPVSAPGRHWLRFLCLTVSTSDLVFTWAFVSRGGSENAYGVVGG